VRIVRLANFVTDTSGGLRTALRQLGIGYRARGHEPVLIVPGATAGDEWTPQGRVITLSGPIVPGTGGYRVIVNRFALRRLLDKLEPDRIEVSDRTTLRWTGAWARRAGVRSMMVSHESLRGLARLATGGSRPAERAADLVSDRLNRRTADAYDRIVCTTAWAAAEFEKLGVANLRRVPLGVDLEQFHPGRHDPALRAELAREGEILLVHCGRLSPEKQPERSIRALATLHERGVPAVLLVIGTGPRRAAMRAAAARAGLPVRFTDHVADRDHLAALLATADVVLAPGPVETFGLAALEALASGTPVVVSAESALPEVVGDAGRAVTGETGRGDAGRAVTGLGPEYADAIVDLVACPETERRAAARRRAECFPWSAAASGFLAAHGAATRAEAVTHRPGYGM
jgi:alpha-1,6-mannosyltransferase